MILPMPDDLYPQELRTLITRGYGRMHRRLAAGAPTLAGHVETWMRSLSRGAGGRVGGCGGGTAPAAYFTHPNAFPMLLLPWWLEEVIGHSPDRAFQGDVVYSTLNGYYFVRMIDDLMDREPHPGSQVLPALIFFHTEFQRAYPRWFPADHPFWDSFTEASLSAAETASKDAGLTEIDRVQFLATSARKIAGARIPIAAVCHRYGRPDLLGPWLAVVDLLGRWHQMLNDIQGWNRDLDHGRHTYFLSEGTRRKGQASISEWVVADGLAWGFGELDAWMRELLDAAQQLDCPPLMAYLEGRRDDIVTLQERLMPGLAALRDLAAALR
jgi:hypothetical protein